MVHQLARPGGGAIAWSDDDNDNAAGKPAGMADLKIEYGGFANTTDTQEINFIVRNVSLRRGQARCATHQSPRPHSECGTK